MRFARMIVAIAVLCCLFSAPVCSAGGLAVSDAVGVVGADTASYSATVANNGAGVANPVIIVVWYDNGVLRDIAASTETIAVGGSKHMSADISGITVADTAKITGFVWEDKIFSVPVAVSEIKKVGNGSTKIESFEIEGIDEPFIQIDDVNKLIELVIPLYDNEGEAFDFTSLDTVVTTENAKASVAVGELALAGTGVSKEGIVDYSSSDAVTVTAENGTVAKYAIKTSRTLFENFESGIVSGFSEGSAGETILRGDFTVKGSAASSIMSIRTINYAINYNEGLSIGVMDISGTRLPLSSNPIPVGASSAANSALRIRKNTHSGEDQDSGNVQLMLNGANMQGLNTATVLTIEYDVAYDFNVSGPKIGGGVAGLDITGSGYRIDTNVGDTTTVAANKMGNIRLQNSGQSTLAVQNATTNTWNHIKVEMDKTAGTAKFYVNGTLEQSAPFTVAWPSGSNFIFGTSARRCVALWLDNISISYR